MWEIEKGWFIDFNKVFEIRYESRHKGRADLHIWFDVPLNEGRTTMNASHRTYSGDEASKVWEAYTAWTVAGRPM